MRAGDLGGMLLLHTSSGNADGLRDLAGKASAQGRANIAFVCHLLLGDVDKCLDILVASNRVSEVRCIGLLWFHSGFGVIVVGG